MKKFFLTVALMVAAISLNAQEILGKWKTDDGSAIIEVYQAGECLNGKIVWLEQATMSDGTPVKDVYNPDKSLRTRELIGLNMLSGLRQKGEKWEGGTIYDPASGKTYRCSMFLDKGVLKVRGYVGPFHRTMDWFRVN